MIKIIIQRNMDTKTCKERKIKRYVVRLLCNSNLKYTFGAVQSI